MGTNRSDDDTDPDPRRRANQPSPAPATPNAMQSTIGDDSEDKTRDLPPELIGGPIPRIPATRRPRLIAIGSAVALVGRLERNACGIGRPRIISRRLVAPPGGVQNETAGR